LKLDDKNCSIDFLQGGEVIGNSSFSIEDAKKAQTKNIDKFPKNMLFARAISNGVKWFCPDVFAGPVYVSEEMPDNTVDVNHIEVIEPTILNKKQFDKVLENVDTLNRCMDAVSEGKIKLSEEQAILIEQYKSTLIN
jgi:hypothetical protein